MFQFILSLVAITNMYNVLFDGNTSSNKYMKEFIENQQYREDQLRYQCNLGNYIIEPKENSYGKFYDNFKYYLSNNIPRFVYPEIMDSPIVSESHEEFIKNSQINSNINRRLKYKDIDFVLKNNNPIIWEFKTDELTLNVCGVKI